MEDPDIVTRINEKLPPQIRVWGIERTNGSFNCYQLCDSRVYEYLIPSHCFLPPHPESFLGKQIVEIAEQENDLEGYKERQKEILDFWKDAQENFINPAVNSVDSHIRQEALSRLYGLSHANDACSKPGSEELSADGGCAIKASSEKAERIISSFDAQASGAGESDPLIEAKTPTPVDEAVRALKTAQNNAKRAWRIPQARLDRVRSALSRFVGSIKYHNYTIDKSWKDPSAIRVIKSFTVAEKPLLIGGTEWLSLKVHGQSFMMHQIRKMVSAAALLVRCGCHEGRLQDTFLQDRLSIPKAPSLGLLLECPIFEKYNEKLAEFGREKIDFGKHEKLISEFKDRQIYQRIFESEEKDGHFLSFFAGLDSTRSATLLWLSSAGLQGLEKDIGAAGPIGSKEGPDEIRQIEGDDEPGAQEDN